VSEQYERQSATLPPQQPVAIRGRVKYLLRERLSPGGREARNTQEIADHSSKGATCSCEGVGKVAGAPLVSGHGGP
jgi:hypothetical protein